MKTFLSCAAMLAMALLAWNADGATPTKKKASKNKKKSTTVSSSSKTGKKKAPAKKSATTWRNRQLAPSTDRYREIQTALAGKGYLKPEDATGSWNSTSSEALKKFQSEQNLDANGKINSLSLIALGLGPKRETPAIPPPPPQQNH
jgi:hypothetical protein